MRFKFIASSFKIQVPKNMRFLIVTSILLLFSLCALHSQSTQTFANYTDIVIPDGQSANIYPSTVEVTGMPDHLVDVSITIHNLLSFGYVGDLDMLLEAPDGQQFLLMSDVPINDFITAFTDLTFNDTSPLLLNANTQFSNMGFRPSNYLATPDTFPTLGVITALPEYLLPLENINPNGTWKLYLNDDNLNDGTFELGKWLVDHGNRTRGSHMCFDSRIKH